MNRMKNIYNLKTIIKAAAFVMLVHVFFATSYVYAEETPKPEQTENDRTPNFKEPDFYKDAKVTKTTNRKGEAVEWVSVKNAHEYVSQNTDYLTKFVLDENTTPDDLAYMLKRYPTTLGDFDGLNAYQQSKVADKLEDMKDDGLITEAQYKEARRKNSLGFDELYKQSMKQAIAVGKGNVEKFDPSKHTKDPAYHAAYNRAAADKRDGIFTDEETKQRQQDYIDDGLAKKHVVETLTDKCQVSRMQGYYQSKCYACVIVKTLLETFLVACSQVYDLTSEAGSKILVIGAMIWLAFFALKNVSSFANVEPGAMVNTLFVFLFKVMVAYIVINSGLTTIIHYTINPLVTAGADYGLGLMSTMASSSGVDNTTGYEAAKYSAVVPTITSADGKTTADIISSDVINKIMLFTYNLDKTVSTNLVIGHALTCHSMNAGAWNFGLFHLVNIWIWLCGAAIWFCGFMLTLGICYYLLDISFKLGFAIIALPVVIGLWPFNVTKDKLTLTISIILTSAATFAFLALTTTYALVLISTALRDIPTLYDAIDNEKVDWISDTFDISGPYFLIIIFAYLYSMKLISSTITDYVDKFFGDGVFGGQSPMHSKMTQATDFAKQKVTGAASAVGGAVTTQAKKGAEKVLKGAGRLVKSAFKGKGKTNSNNNKGSNNAVSNAGSATKAAGKTMQQTGQATQQAGQMAQKGGKMMSKGGDGMMKAGKALSGTGLGAIIGVPMMIAGGAIKGAGAVTEYAGKATKKAGQAMKKSGKAMQKIGDKMEKAGNKMEQAGNTMKYGKGGSPASNTPPQNPPSSNSSGGTTP